MNYDEIYEEWGTFPQCKIPIDLGDDIPESVWGRVINEEEDLYGIDNNPLCPELCWQDIVRGKRVGNASQVIHRRWNTRVWFGYDEAKEKDDAEIQRKRIWQAGKDVDGDVSFWSPGVGIVAFKPELEGEPLADKMNKLQEAAGIELYPVEPNED